MARQKHLADWHSPFVSTMGELCFPEMSNQKSCVAKGHTWIGLPAAPTAGEVGTPLKGLIPAGMTWWGGLAVAKGDLRGVPGGSPAGGRPAKTMVCCCPAPGGRGGYQVWSLFTTKPSLLRKGLLWPLRFPVSHTYVCMGYSKSLSQAFFSHAKKNSRRKKLKTQGKTKFRAQN